MFFGIAKQLQAFTKPYFLKSLLNKGNELETHKGTFAKILIGMPKDTFYRYQEFENTDQAGSS
jgi:hypothetical protein